MSIREKKHRLPREFYIGKISAAFTVCIKDNVRLFINPEIVSVFTDILASVTAIFGCIVPVYCFMPDHQHIIITGTSDDSDVWKTMVHYKQKTGFWMARNRPQIKWQKDFYDHVMRKHEDIVTQVKYVLDNPVRKGFVSMWEEYPFKGSIGCSLEDILNAII